MKFFSKLVNRSSKAEDARKLDPKALAAVCAAALLTGAYALPSSTQAEVQDTKHFEAVQLAHDTTMSFDEARAHMRGVEAMSQKERDFVGSILQLELGFKVYTVRDGGEIGDIRELADAQLADAQFAREMMEAEIASFGNIAERERKSYEQYMRRELRDLDRHYEEHRLMVEKDLLDRKMQAMDGDEVRAEELNARFEAMEAEHKNTEMLTYARLLAEDAAAAAEFKAGRAARDEALRQKIAEETRSGFDGESLHLAIQTPLILEEIKTEHQEMRTEMITRHNAELAAFDAAKAQEFAAFSADMRAEFDTRMAELKVVDAHLDTLDRLNN